MCEEFKFFLDNGTYLKCEKFKSSRLNDCYFKFQHRSGLTVFLYNTPGYSTAKAFFATKYGSLDNKFKIHGESDYVEVTPGIAHFLEHKMFENKNQEHAFVLFAAIGAGVNADTSYERTRYYFVSTNNNLLNSLKVLMKFVQEPYFTNETVSKEQGIIGQEIDGIPTDWLLIERLFKDMFHEHSIKIPIEGTKESIAKIDVNALYKCYNTFYNPRNMCLLVSGDFDRCEVLNAIDENINSEWATNSKKIDRFVEEEPLKIVKSYDEIDLPIANEIFAVGYKLKPVKLSECLKIKILLTIAMKVICDDLCCNLYDEGLISDDNMSLDVDFGEGFAMIIIYAKSEHAVKVHERINEEICFKQKNGFSKDEFNRKRNVIYSEIISKYGTPDGMDMAIEDGILGYGLYDRIEICAKAVIGDVDSVIDMVDVENSTLIVGKPRN